jgi:hypothetical protein
MEESKSGNHGWMSPNWGFVAAGVLLPVLTKVVARWLPLPYASAVTSFVVFYAAYCTGCSAGRLHERGGAWQSDWP